jgi:hypothetical protein
MKKLALFALLAMPLLGGCAYSGGAYAGYDPYFDSGYQGYERPASYYGQSEDYGRPYGSAYEGSGYSDQAYYGQTYYAAPQPSYYSYSYAAAPTVYSGNARSSHHRVRSSHPRCAC